MINIGDLITLKGMNNIKEKPLGIVIKIWTTDHVEIMWLNHDISDRYALRNAVNPKKLDVVRHSND